MNYLCVTSSPERYSPCSKVQRARLEPVSARQSRIQDIRIQARLNLCLVACRLKAVVKAMLKLIAYSSRCWQLIISQDPKFDEFFWNILRTIKIEIFELIKLVSILST